ncbi:MAG TPA: urease accessory UreF family protein [Verrucomicrobiae bacterium]|jgi:urease accessory protein|nr:urease accessory UreF family protein [Verrucomicrobiae bacterium]
MEDNTTLTVDSPFAIRHSSFDQWLLWQLADSAFPTGGFAHSSGLEGAWQHGEVRNRNELLSFVEAGLHQLGRAALPFMNAAYVEPESVDEFDNLCDAFTTNHVANRASRAQGKAFLATVQRVFVANVETDRMPVLRFNHLACVFGAAMRQLEISRETARQLFFFNQLRGIMAAAVRLNIVGPMEAQALQRQLTPVAEEVLNRCESLTLEDIAQTSPLLDMWQGAQDRLYSRLFQS